MSSEPRGKQGQKKGTGLVPRLRFPEFRGEREWESSELNNALSSIANGLVVDQGNDTTGFKVTRIETISSGTIDLERVGLIRTSQDISDFKLRPGDILLSNINSITHIGKSAFVDRDYDLYHGMNLLRLIVNKAKNNPLFIYYLINTGSIRASLRERANKAVNQASINQTELGKTKISMPHKMEQQKIADCLSSLDDLITLESRKLNALKQHKKGLMQQLFPAEGETVPRLRFPEFREEWQSLPMSMVYSFKGNNPLSRDKLNYTAGSYKNIHYGDIHTKFAQHFRADIELVPYINEGESHSTIRPENYCMAGDMIFADASEDIADIGKVIEIIDGGNIPLVSGLHTIFARPNKGSITLGFGAYLFSSEVVRKQVQREAQGAKVLGLSATRLGNVLLHYPREPEEQRKIADCLSSLDDLITLESRKLDALKQHKKGLMQQLFPVLDDTVA